MWLGLCQCKNGECGEQCTVYPCDNNPLPDAPTHANGAIVTYFADVPPLPDCPAWPGGQLRFDYSQIIGTVGTGTIYHHIAAAWPYLIAAATGHGRARIGDPAVLTSDSWLFLPTASGLVYRFRYRFAATGVSFGNEFNSRLFYATDRHDIEMRTAVREICVRPGDITPTPPGGGL